MATEVKAALLKDPTTGRCFAVVKHPVSVVGEGGTYDEALCALVEQLLFPTREILTAQLEYARPRHVKAA